MKTLSVLKKDLDFNKGLASLIETLKTIAASQYRILEQKLKSFEELATTVESFFEFIDVEGNKHPFLRPRSKKQGVITVTSDTGLLGGLNMQVVATAIKELEKIPGKLIVIGERGRTYLRESSIPFAAFGGISDEHRYGQAVQLRDYIVSEVMKGTFSYLTIVYPRPVTFTVQRVEVIHFLPYLPSRTKGSGEKKEISGAIMESRPEDIAEYLIYLLMGHKFNEIFGLSRLAEFAARFVHLEESGQKLKELDQKTRLEYFRVRHELIDRNMRELFAARLLYARQS